MKQGIIDDITVQLRWNSDPTHPSKQTHWDCLVWLQSGKRYRCTWAGPEPTRAMVMEAYQDDCRDGRVNKDWEVV